MAVTTIPWGDGSGDNIYLTYSASQGDQTVLVSSDANSGAARQKVITFVSTVGNISRSLTVLQESGMDYVSITWNDVCITYNDTAIAYPYEEQYIVFVDSEVEAICVANWGDGTGIKPSQAAQVTNAQFGTTFRDNTDIESFDELQYFTGLTKFSNYAFQGCTSLTSFTFPPNVTALSLHVLYGCTSLEEVDLNNISERGYAGQAQFIIGCTALCRVYLKNLDQWMLLSENTTGTAAGYNECPFNSNNHDNYIYVNDVEVRNLVIPTGYSRIKVYCFYYCNRLQSVVVPEGVTEICNSAFRGSASPVPVSLPSTLTTLSGGSIFRDDAALTTINLPGSITEIPASCFQACESLVIPTLPSTLTTIGSYAFYNCKGQTPSLVIPSTVTSMNTNTFNGCSGLASVQILCASIGQSAFANCSSLTNVEVGPLCTSIGTQAFYAVGTTANKCTYILRPTTPPTLASTNAFTANRINKIYVPNGKLSAYQTASNWSSFASYMAELDANGNIPT